MNEPLCIIHHDYHTCKLCRRTGVNGKACAVDETHNYFVLHKCVWPITSVGITDLKFLLDLEPVIPLAKQIIFTKSISVLQVTKPLLNL